MKKIILLLFISNLSMAGSIDPNTAVAEHNKWRNILNRGELGSQPRPDPFIQDTYWDPLLAESAQSHTDKCVWEHSNTGGENLYAHSGSYGSMTEGIRLWVDEHKDYDFASNKSVNGELVGHYTQAVWDDSLKVGCAATQCRPIRYPDGSALWDGTFYACQYRESGNWVGYQPYETEGSITSKVELTSANGNLDLQLLNLNGYFFRVKMKITTDTPLLFELVAYQQIDNSRADGIKDIAYFDRDSIIIPRVSIDGIDRYYIVLKHRGELLFELTAGGER